VYACCRWCVSFFACIFFISPLYILFRLVVAVDFHLRLLLVELLNLGQLRLNHILRNVVDHLISKDGGVFERLLGIGDVALFDLGLGDQDLGIKLPLLVGSFNRGLVRVLTVDLGIVKLALLEETSAPIVIDPRRLGAGFDCL